MWDKLVILGGDFTIIQLVLTLTKLFDRVGQLVNCRVWVSVTAFSVSVRNMPISEFYPSICNYFWEKNKKKTISLHFHSF